MVNESSRAMYGASRVGQVSFPMTLDNFGLIGAIGLGGTLTNILMMLPTFL